MIVTMMFLLFAIAIIVRFVQILPKSKNRTKAGNVVKRSLPIKTCVVLGSGGHTSEMCTLIKSMDKNKYQFEFVVAQTDEKSEPFARSNLVGYVNEPFLFHYIPRSREVHQSYFSSIFSTLHALLHTTSIIIFKINPDLILVNGPGTCVPVCFSSYIPRFLGLKHVKIIFVESAARVKSLSLSGKILYRFVDRFIVHWPDLAQRYHKAEYLGRLC